MKKPTIRLFFSIGFFLLGAALFVLSFRLQRDHAVATTSLSKLDLAIHQANRIEILFLSSNPSEPSQETFTTAGYGETYFVTDTRSLRADSVAELKKILEQHYFTTEMSTACHTPGQVLRFYENSALLLDASLCLECTNLHFLVYPFTPASVTLGQKDSTDFFNLPALAEFLETVREGT